MNQSKLKKCLVLFLVVTLVISMSNDKVQASRETKVTKIVLNVKSKEMEVGQKFKLKVKKVKLSKGSKKVKWKSGNNSIASINKKGMVTANGSGTVKITAVSTANKKIKAFCMVTVKNKKAVANTLPDYSGSSIQGVQGAQGEKGQKGDQGAQGIQGEKGEQGNPGAQGLQGEKGDSGEQGAQGEKGDKGDQGEPGPQGEKGDKGDSGASIVKAYIDEDGDLILVLSDGTIINAGPIGTQVLQPDVTGTQMYAGTVKVRPGERNVKVILSVKNNPGILGMTLSVKYDQKVLTLKSAENGTAIKDVLTMTTGAVLQSGCKFTWDGENINDNQIKDGDILILTFDVANDVQAGSYDIEFTYNEGDIVDRNLDTVNLNVGKGSIVVG